jgi:hypothetical protein
MLMIFHDEGALSALLGGFFLVEARRASAPSRSAQSRS